MPLRRMEALEGQWMCPRNIINEIKNGWLIWGADYKSNAEPLSLRPDVSSKDLDSHFCAFRRESVNSSSPMYWVSLASPTELVMKSGANDTKEVWHRFSPGIARRCASGQIKLLKADGEELAGRFTSGIINVGQLRRLVAINLGVSQLASCQVTITDSSTGRVLQDVSDLQDSTEAITLNVSTDLAAIVASKRLLVVHSDGTPLHADLSTVQVLGDIRTIVSRETSRPARFVRLYACQDDKKFELQFDELPADAWSIRIEVHLGKTVAELLCRDEAQVLAAFSGEPLHIDLARAARMITIGDLREWIARAKDVPPTCVKLIAPSGKQLWNRDSFALNDLGPGSVIAFCLRDPTLCDRGEHEYETLFSNGYNDRVCIHCGPSWILKGRPLEPLHT